MRLPIGVGSARWAMSVVCIATAFVGCIDDVGALPPPPVPRSDLGSASFSLSVKGLQVNSVHYKIRSLANPDVPDREGDAAVPGEAAVLVTDLHAGDYSINRHCRLFFIGVLPLS